MTNNDVATKSTKYGVPKNSLSTWVKNSHKQATPLEKKRMSSSSSRKSTHVGSTTKQIKQFSTGLLEKKPKKFQLMGSYVKKKPQNLRKHWELRNLKHWIAGSISERKGINIKQLFICPLLYCTEYFYKEFAPFFLGLKSSTCKKLAFRPRRQD